MCIVCMCIIYSICVYVCIHVLYFFIAYKENPTSILSVKVLYKLMPAYIFNAYFTSYHGCASFPSTIACFHVSGPWIRFLLSPYFTFLDASFFSILCGTFFLWKLGQLLSHQFTHCALQEVSYLYLQFLHYLFIIKYVDMCCCSGWNKKHSLFILYTQTHCQHSIQYTFLLWSL